jgi:uncharacterized ferritin-like protein (DUF455 family)
MDKMSDFWKPFVVVTDAQSKGGKMNDLDTSQGVLDRLCFVAFAEKQAENGYLWAVERFDVDQKIKNAWKKIALDEKRHGRLLLERLFDLGGRVEDTPQNLRLWQSFQKCKTPLEFAYFMATAENRGKQAGEQFYEKLQNIDPVSAQLFQQIAFEEQEHIQINEEYFGFSVSSASKPF